MNVGCVATYLFLLYLLSTMFGSFHCTPPRLGKPLRTFCMSHSLFVPHFLHYCLLLSIFCSEKSKFLSHFLLCIFYNYFLCGYHGDYIQHVEVLILKSEFIPA